MSELIHVEADFGDLTRTLRQLAPAISKQLRKQLRDIAKEVALEVREEVPSGMAKAKTKGVRWGYWGSKGAVIEVGGNDTPASWVGAYDGAGGKSTFRHPVHGGKNRPRSQWGWAEQATNPILEKKWAERQTWAVLKSEEAIQKAIQEAGFRTE